VQDNVEVPEPLVTVAGVRLQTALSDVRATPPVKPFTGVIMMVEVAGELTTVVTEVGFAEMAKSGWPVTVNVTVTE